MTLTLNLPPELEQYLAQEAKQQGLSVETYTLQILQEYILPKRTTNSQGYFVLDINRPELKFRANSPSPRLVD